MVAVGNVNLDLTVLVERPPSPDEKLVAHRHYLGLGGAATNFSVACARLGLSCGLVAKVGLDPPGEMALRRLEAEGVDISHVSACPDAPTGLALILWTREGRGLVSCRGANDRLSPEDLEEARPYLSSARVVLGASLRLDVAEALASICSGGPRLILDPGGTLASHGIGELSGILSSTFIYAPNEVELYRSTGLRDLRRALEAAWSAGPELVVVKSGPRGCFIFDGERLRHVRAPRPARVLDPTGAGDAFNAGLVLGLLNGLGIVESARLAVATAALKVGRRGASNMPYLAELRAFLGEIGWHDLASSLAGARRHR